MAHRRSFVALCHKARDRKFTHMIRSIFVSDMEFLRDIKYRLLGLAPEKFKNFQSPMTSESFYYPFESPIIHTSAFINMIPLL